eukprot:gene7069-9649_t
MGGGSSFCCIIGSQVETAQMENGKIVNSIKTNQSLVVTPKNVDSERLSARSHNKIMFSSLMQDPKGREFFMKFLKSEHAEENLIFFEEIENLKKMNNEKFVSQTQILISSYLLPGVQNEVNVSAVMKQSIVKMNEDMRVQHELFLEYLEKAQHEIVLILALGSFPRFLKTVEYKLWLQQRERFF